VAECRGRVSEIPKPASEVNDRKPAAKLAELLRSRPFLQTIKAHPVDGRQGFEPCQPNGAVAISRLRRTPLPNDSDLQPLGSARNLPLFLGKGGGVRAKIRDLRGDRRHR